MNQPDEGDWIRKAQAGDRQAYAALVERWWLPVRRWLFGLTGKIHAAEDLTQETFFRAWSGLPRLQSEETFRVWLFRIARNCLIDSRRGPRGADTRELPENLPDKTDEPLGALIEGEAHQQLHVALGRLPSAYRAAFLLWTHEEMPYHHIAQVLAVSEETARWRVCKARQFLLKEMQSYLVDPQR